MKSGLAGSGGHVRIVITNEEVELDKVGWGSALDAETTPAGEHAKGQSLKRQFSEEKNWRDLGHRLKASPID